MKRIIKIGSMLLVGALLIGLASLPVASTQTDINGLNSIDQKMQSINAAENGIISQIQKPADYTKNLTEAEKIRLLVEKDMRKNMDESINDVSNNVQALTLDTVYLGTDRTFTNADYSNGGISPWGVAPMWHGWDPYLSSRRGEAGSLVGPGGYGGTGAWIQVGKTFTVSGSGSRSANIRMSGHMYGLTTAFAGGTSNSIVNLVVKDTTTGTTYSTNLYNQGAGGAGWYEVNQDFNNGINVNLQSGHSYIAYLELQTSAAVYGAGEAGSDFGRYDGDYAGEGVWYNSIIVDF